MRDAVLMAEAWLLTYLLQSSVLLGAAWCISTAARRAFTRHAEWLWRVAFFGGVITTSAQFLVASLGVSLLPLAGGGTQSFMTLPVMEAAKAASIASRMAIDAARAAAMPLVACWILVAFVRAIALVRAHRLLRRRLASRTPIRDETIVTRLRSLAAGRLVLLSHSSEVRSPIVFRRNEIVLPTRALCELTVPELDAVLAHEVAHIARGDAMWLTAAGFMQHILFLQPLNAVASSRLRAISEYSCDDWAVRQTRDPVAMASALARVTDWLTNTTVDRLAIAMASTPSLGLARVRRILDPSVVRARESSLGVRGGVAMALLLAGMFAAPHVSLATLRGELAPLVRYTITAADLAGEFTVTLEHGRVIDATLAGKLVARERIHQTGDLVRVDDVFGLGSLELTLTADGGIRWSSRVPR